MSLQKKRKQKQKHTQKHTQTNKHSSSFLFFFLNVFRCFLITYFCSGVIPCHSSRTLACLVQDEPILLQTFIITHCTATLLYFFFQMIQLFAALISNFCISEKGLYKEFHSIKLKLKYVLKLKACVKEASTQH